MKNDETFSYYAGTFLDNYIGGERGLSENTFISYNYTLGNLTEFLFFQIHNRNKKVTMKDFTADNVRSYLDHIEEVGCSVSTRNQRLATIKSFCKFIRYKSPRHLHSIDQILDIPSKHGNTPAIQYLTSSQLERLLSKPNSADAYGFKDLLLLTIMADTGARVSEIINIKISDIRLEKPATIIVNGKGNRDRYVTISKKTVGLLNLFYEKEGLRSPICSERHLFLNRSGKPFTRAGVAYILQKYTTQLHNEEPSMFPANLTPHCLRHTKAMMMLEAGQNLIYIRDTLGHASIKTTEIYARINSKQRQEAMDSVNNKVKIPDSPNIDYKNDAGIRNWLHDYCQ